ncbi:Mitochondrial distribution and morphology protein 12 [Ascosphaera acerosa]|nr:Mitochondrial distribution and morphology protein 12 [Ascosphaera acerosa]
MSISINWAEATGGPDGEALAERIRSFINGKFQQVKLPSFIRSVQVTAFDLGKIAPELEIKDLSDPFADFYEDEDDEDGAGDGSDEDDTREAQQEHARSDAGAAQYDGAPPAFTTPSWAQQSPGDHYFNAYRFFPRPGTSGILGGTPNGLRYPYAYPYPYNHPSFGGLSGTATPFAAGVRGVSPVQQYPPVMDDVDDDNGDDGGDGRPATQSAARGQGQPPCSPPPHFSPLLPATATAAAFGHFPSPAGPPFPPRPRALSSEADRPSQSSSSSRQRQRGHQKERTADDFQVFCHVKYAGDIRLSITADILLDYPMPSFVGLPLKLNITGLTFDGVAVVAYIRRKIHLCFLSPEDTELLMNPSSNAGHTTDTNQEGEAGATSAAPTPAPATAFSARRGAERSLLRHLQVESEIGRQEDGKQVLKNVGKVEKFVLEQVRRIFDDEFVYPSFWTFLV